MIQRVGIAQAMLNDPKILILDEPTAGLDPKERVRFRNLISSLPKDRIVILSTHIVSDTEAIAKRVIIFKNQRLFANDEPAALCAMITGKIYETERSVPQNSLALTERQESGKTVTRLPSCSSLPPAPALRLHPRPRRQHRARTRPATRRANRATPTTVVKGVNHRLGQN